VLWRVRPERVVLRGVSPGLAAYVASLLPTLELGETRIVWVTPGPHAALDGVEQIVGALDGAETLARIDAMIGEAEQSLVVFQPGGEEALPVAALAAYARFVTFGSYLVALDTALGQPWLGYSRSWLYRAIVRFTQGNPGFVIDRTLNRHFVTTCPSGFLRRVLDPLPFGRYDEALDDLSGV
jgi:cephalosporin hydroxylase